MFNDELSDKSIVKLQLFFLYMLTILYIVIELFGYYCTKTFLNSCWNPYIKINSRCFQQDLGRFMCFFNFLNMFVTSEKQRLYLYWSDIKV
ncbi:hypothetical protein CLU79DRAFT_765668 [Phycomyces nitens]|nr:hypothetical protein CLU79DRAFT_765668 [Phycomyces nitens]